MKLFSTHLPLAVGAMLAALTSVNSLTAGTIGYWQLEGSAGGNITSAASQVNNSDLTSSVFTRGTGANPLYVADTPGPFILDGIGGPVVNANNVTSSSFAPTDNFNGSLLTFQDAPGNDNLLEPTGAFTFEFFVKTTSNDTFRVLAGKQAADTSLSFGVQQHFSGTRLQYISATNSAIYDTNNSSVTPGRTRVNDGEWHHVALVFDGVDSISAYYDYELFVGNDPFTGGPGVWTDNVLSVGGIIGNLESDSDFFTGQLDELRYSDVALAPDAFLVASTVPEPTTAATLIGASMLALGYRRRRQRRS